jgi:hypothetical protein
VSAASEFGSWHHLAGRFFGALSPLGPRAADESWALQWLLPGEQALWYRMSGPDRRHAVGVARRTIEMLAGRGAGEPPSRDVVAAALLHDVGKVEAGLGTFGRVAVTLAAMVAGRDRLAEAGSDGHGGRLRRRVSLYLTHDRVGGGLLRGAGSADLTWTWAEQHHTPESRWTVDRRVGAALKAADGD